ncbi:MAG: DUF4340 domain-containing protein [Treponema sp.]|nr:DUF4340 domain-containing protein [Candidatus Treponema equifaecale]
MTKDKLLMRKYILLGAIAVFAVIYALQLVMGAKSPVKDFKIEKSFDTIQIVSADNGTVELKRYGDFWKIGVDDTDLNKVKAIAETVKSIRTLGEISKSSSEDAVERYGLTDAQKITVKVSDNGKEYLSMEIGKDAANGQQNYVRMNGSSTIYLASGALRSAFNVKTEELIKAPEPVPEAAPAAEGEAAVPVL